MGNSSGGDGVRGTGEDARDSNGWADGIVSDDSKVSLAISAIVSVAAEKAGGD